MEGKWKFEFGDFWKFVEIIDLERKIDLDFLGIEGTESICDRKSERSWSENKKCFDKVKE